jgi:hypothetical protein
MPTRVGEVQPRDIVVHMGSVSCTSAAAAGSQRFVCLFLHMLDLVVFHVDL